MSQCIQPLRMLDLCWRVRQETESPDLGCDRRPRSVSNYVPYCVHTLCPHAVTTHYVHTLCPHAVSTRCDYTLCPHAVSMCCVNTLCLYAVTTQYVHTL